MEREDKDLTLEELKKELEKEEQREKELIKEEIEALKMENDKKIAFLERTRKEKQRKSELNERELEALKRKNDARKSMEGIDLEPPKHVAQATSFLLSCASALNKVIGGPETLTRGLHTTSTAFDAFSDTIDVADNLQKGNYYPAFLSSKSAKQNYANVYKEIEFPRQALSRMPLICAGASIVSLALGAGPEAFRGSKEASDMFNVVSTAEDMADIIKMENNHEAVEQALRQIRESRFTFD